MSPLERRNCAHVSRMPERGSGARALASGAGVAAARATKISPKWLSVGRGAEPSRADAAEGQHVTGGEFDRPGLVEGAVIRQDEARDEQRFLTLARLDTPSEPVPIDGRDQHLARRACALLQHS